jgi:hypothetical protein
VCLKLVDKYSKKFDLKWNLSKYKILVLKKEGKLTATESREMNGQNSEVVDKFNYQGVMMGSVGGWNKQKTPAKLKDIKQLQLQTNVCQ